MASFWITMAAAMFYTIAGYYKKKPKQKFNTEKFMTVLLMGMVLGGIMFFLKLDYNGATQFSISMGAITAIEYATKVITRRIINPKTWKLRPEFKKEVKANLQEIKGRFHG